MKLTHPLAIKSAALVASMGIKCWFTTLSPRVSMDDRTVEPQHAAKPTLYLFWHEMMLAPAVYWAKTRIPVLVSQHRDGELIAQIVRMFGGQAIRGSTNRQGFAALREMLRRAEGGHLAITPDGPRGPRRHVHIGSIYLASRANMQVVPVGFAFSHCWRAGSWDHMAWPQPFGIVQTVTGRPIEIPEGVSKEQLDPYRNAVQAAMDDCQDRAERLVARYVRRRASRSARAFTEQEAEQHPARPLQQILVH